MCGIFGVTGLNNLKLEFKHYERLLAQFFKIAETRGKEAMGLAIINQSASNNRDISINIFKSAGRATKIIKKKRYKEFLKDHLHSETTIGFFGHSRLVTNGWRVDDVNNHPILTDNITGIHNGIIVNYEELKEKFPNITLESNLDSELLFKIIDYYSFNYSHKNENNNIKLALKKTFEIIEGVANLAFVNRKENSIQLATNNGSIYYAVNEKICCFASEYYFLQKLIIQKNLGNDLRKENIIQLKSGEFIPLKFFGKISKPVSISKLKKVVKHKTDEINISFIYQNKNTMDIRRCSKCLLPDSFPAITFNECGVCSVCQGYIVKKAYGKNKLQRIIEEKKKNRGEVDCLVAFSGGRDSSYGLHYIKRELGLNPIAYTYDWGMVTDIARRNQSRLCSKLGIEHIIRSPDIPTKRRFIRKNLGAWLNKPDLGMIPILMAGDKQYYHYTRKVQKELNLNLVFHCAGNELERTEFKSGFCNIKESNHGQVMWRYSLKNKLGLVYYFLKKFIGNPGYINESFFDMLYAYYSTFVSQDNFLYLYHFIQWDEKIITNTLRDVYGWEIAEDTNNTWRIGDGTAAFYNYIYHTIAGFSEHDTFRSNQIRHGLISRDEGLELIAEDNLPRWDAMREYADLVGFNFQEAIEIINTAKKRY